MKSFKSEKMKTKYSLKNRKKSTEFSCKLTNSTLLNCQVTSSQEKFSEINCSSFLTPSFEENNQKKGVVNEFSKNSFSVSKAVQHLPPKLNLCNFPLNQNTMAPSASCDSTSSGFLSFSPPACSIKDRSWFDDRDLDISENAPTLNNYKCTSEEPHLRFAREKKDNIALENIYDEVAGDLSESEDGDFSESAVCLFRKMDNSPIPYPSPEFCFNSENDNSSKSQKKCMIPSLLNSLPITSKTKIPLKLLKSKKTKQTKNNNFLDDDTFLSPSYDENLVMPVVEGWEEIDFTTSLFHLKNNSYSSNVYLPTDRKKNDDIEKITGFLTVVPKNRQRPKASRLRNNHQTNLSVNYLVPVPTPSVPTKPESSEKLEN